MITAEHEPTSPLIDKIESREKLKQQIMQRQMAATVFYAILVASYQGQRGDRFFGQPEATSSPHNRADVFSLINHAFDNNFEKHDNPAPNSPFTPDVSGYRDSIFNPTTPEPASEFRPAPSMSEKPVGPQLPNLSFNDRIRPWAAGSKQPSEADFAAAGRANDMYQHELFKTGWRGGEASPDEQKSAAHGLARKYHPDYPTTSLADAEAVKMFNASHARPTTPGQPGRDSKPTSSPQ